MKDEQSSVKSPEADAQPSAQTPPEEAPEILRVMVRGTDGVDGRRRFVRDVSAVVGAAALGAVQQACESDYGIVGPSAISACRCHVVCTCDTVGPETSSEYTVRYTGTVCTCNTVCTCDTVSTGGGGGGGGGHYWYPN